MRTLFVTEFISLDGVIDSPGGEPGYAHAGWTMDVDPDPEMFGFKLAETLDTEALLLGRVTYEGFAAAWPERDGDFADAFNTMPKYVVSSRLAAPSWANTTVLPVERQGQLVSAVREVKAAGDGRLQVAGSATLVKALLEADLVDELHLMVFPLVLGSGRRLFPDDAADKRAFTLTESVTYANGVQLMRLRREH